MKTILLTDTQTVLLTLFFSALMITIINQTPETYYGISVKNLNFLLLCTAQIFLATILKKQKTINTTNNKTKPTEEK